MKKQSLITESTATSTNPDRIYRQVSEADIAQRAYEIYESRGYQHGADLDDWLQAERELTEQPSSVRGIARGAA